MEQEQSKAALEAESVVKVCDSCLWAVTLGEIPFPTKGFVARGLNRSLFCLFVISQKEVFFDNKTPNAALAGCPT